MENSKKFKELTEDELTQVTGGGNIFHGSYSPATCIEVLNTHNKNDDEYLLCNEFMTLHPELF